MSLTFIALVGILVGFLCLVIGFFMEDGAASSPVRLTNGKRARTLKKKIIVPRRKAA